MEALLCQAIISAIITINICTVNVIQNNSRQYGDCVVCGVVLDFIS